MKLIKDWSNGGLWQWRYFSAAVGLWFDYGNPFRDHANAVRWMEDGGIQT